MEFITHSKEETWAIGEKLGKKLEAGMVITLAGDLGAGKTTFTQGIGKGLGVKRAINSPTFTIMKIYEGSLPLYHIDAYRLEEHFQDLGFEEYLDGDGVSVVEWSDFISEILPAERLNIEISYVDENSRKLAFKPVGLKYEELVKEL